MSLTGSMAITTLLKVLLPGFAKVLVDNLGIDNNLTNKLLEQTIDVAAEGLSEEDKRQALTQQTQKLAERLQQEMQPFFETEAKNLDEGGRSAIFYAVAQTLTQGSISLDGLINISLDADRLAKHLLTDPKTTAGLSENEKSLYKRAIALASSSLIEMVPQLEGFQLSVTKAMLRQNEELLNDARSRKELALQQRDQFLRRYRQVIATELDKPDKFGVPLLKNLLSRQKLCEAYVQLSITEKIEEFDYQVNLFDFKEQEDESLSLIPKREKFLETKSQNIESALSTHRRLVIRGGAGAGKTSLMHWLAVHAARQDFEAPLKHWNSLVPFFIRLRSWVDDGFPAAQDFVQPIAKNIADEMPVGWVRQQLDSGCALVLIDGVDEMPRPKRQPFFEALQKLVTEFPNAIYITTSRPAGLKDENGEEWVEWESWMKAEQFGNCVMEPMTLPVIEQFVSRWHRALPEPSQHVDKEPQKVAENLMREIKKRIEIRKLAETPLLCTMICALHYENEGSLPGTRLRLYDKCIEMLLEERDKQRDIQTGISLTLAQKEGFLMEFAYWLMRNNYSDAKVEKADRQFQDYLKEYTLPNVTGREIRQLLLERSGLLREPLMGRIDFVHRTFQEYLAAKAVLDHDDLGVLLDHADEDQWREAIIVAVGKGSRPQRRELLSQLLQRGDENSEKQHYLHLLTVACLETGVAIDSDLRAKIEACAKALLPPKNDDETDTVARSGDAIVPFLAYKSNLSADEANFCIATLVKIGSLAAMQLLVEYAQAKFDLEKSSFHISWSIGRGYDVFEPEIYAKQVLTQLQYLDFRHTNIQDILFLSSLTQLQYLNLSWTQIKNLWGLSSLIRLQYLDLSETQTQDISFLFSLTQLQYLNLSGTWIQEISVLSSLTQIQDLNLSETKIQDISALSSLAKLQSLDLSGTEIEDISALSSLAKLQNLDLSRTEIEDISALSSLTQLRVLNLSETKIENISVLSSLTQLQHLNLSETKIQDISALSSLAKLQSLDLSGTEIEDISALSSLTQIQHLNLSGTEIEDISALSSLTQIQHLNLSGTEIEDISALSSLTQIQHLNLSDTKIEDISALSSLTKLRYLCLNGTKIQDISILSSLTQLQRLMLFETQVNDFTPLKKLTHTLKIYLKISQSDAAESLIALRNFQIYFID
jgi:Leucine-rich repeat (LRR) protein